MRTIARFLSLCALFIAFAVPVCSAQITQQTATTNPAIIPVPRSEVWWLQRHAERLEKVKAGGYDLLFLGDSITQNYEKTGPAPDETFFPIWQEFFTPHRALNLGYSGDQTQHVLWRLQHGEIDGLAPKDVVILIGTNNTADKPGGARPQTSDEVAAGVEAVVDVVHLRLPQARILLLQILPSAVSETKSNKDAVVNSLLRLHFSGNLYVNTLDLSRLYLKNGVLESTLFYDPRLKPARGPLHPDTVGQKMMAEAVAHALYAPPQQP